MMDDPDRRARALLPETILTLARQARDAESEAELRFLLVNETRALADYRQSAFWLAGLGVRALSGVAQIEANAPYAQWLEKLCTHLASTCPQAAIVTAEDLPPALGEEWSEWLPDESAWLPTPARDGVPSGGLLLARERHWTESELAGLREWLDIWWHSWRAFFKVPMASWRGLRYRLLGDSSSPSPWWRRRSTAWLVAIAVLLCMPVRLSVRAPGELVPVHPIAIRSPLEGVVDRFFVQPNDVVAKDQPLLALDDALLKSKLDVARQALSTAETDYRQTSQLALSDAKSKGLLALQLGKIEEKRAEVDYLQGQLGRVRVLAPAEGTVLLDDPAEWIGRPVSLGERILRIAATQDSEVEAWVPIGDAIALPPGSPATLYLDASPLQPISARLRYVAHEAQQRPDGTFAYRARATLVEPTAHRVGLKGTARLDGRRVPLAYYLLRRPLASLRTTLGY